MIDQPDLFRQTPIGTVIGVDRAVGRDHSVTVVRDRSGIIAQLPEAPRERAAFVRHHIAEIVKKGKTAASHRTKGKLLLAKCEAVGDTAAGDEARAEYLMAERAEILVECHIMALINRTAIDG